MITPKEKAEELYNRFNMIIYTDQDHESQVLSCMSYFIESMINEHLFDEDITLLLFWENVKIEKERLK